MSDWVPKYIEMLEIEFWTSKPIDIKHLPLNPIDIEALYIEVDEVQSSRLELAVREEQHWSHFEETRLR